MKKSFILASTLFLATLVQADYYVGLNYLTGSGTQSIEYDTYYSNEDIDIDSSGVALKFGFSNSLSRFEISYFSVDVEDDDGGDATFNGLDFDWIRPFDVHPMAKPFISLGFGYHQWDGFEGVDITGDSRDRMAFSLNIGAGALYKIEMFELEAGYKYKYYIWEDVDYTYYTRSDSTSLGNFYAGVNFHF